MAETKDTIIKTYEFKLRTNISFVEACQRELEHSRQIYNAALAERISCYRITGASLSYAEQSRHLTEARTLPEVKSHLRTIQQDALERIDEAFKGFFRRVQGGGNPAFPDSRAKTAITPSRRNTRKSDLARSKATSSQFPELEAVVSGSPAQLKDNANSFGSRAALMVGMRFWFVSCRNLKPCRQPDRLWG